MRKYRLFKGKVYEIKTVMRWIYDPDIERLGDLQISTVDIRKRTI
jgi:hypothetical protein